ncbi:coiled-coil domain-containing protein [Anaplasma marginale]|uniref:Appendage-associated protein n=1 Tax=Anaplasma marginale TaxID=770 RepID=A0A643CL13_ANAMA|nr:hypothetical protein [Anaplasma marginale]KAB0451620.1 hypothetical protein FY207_03630 [Anaplasma marginale]
MVVVYVTVGRSARGNSGSDPGVAEKLRLAENARLRLALLGQYVVKAHEVAKQAREELRNELDAIAAKWRPIIELRKELNDIDAAWRPVIELAQELKAIDAEWEPAIRLERAYRAIIGSIELSRELKAIDAEWRPKILEEAQEKLAAAKALEEAAKLNELGGMSTTPTPSTASIGVATDTAIAMGSSQQQSAGSAIASEELRKELSTINDRIELILKLRATDTENQHSIIAEAEKKLIRAAEALEDAASKLEKLGGMSTTSTPSTDLIGVATDTAIAMGPSQQQAADAGSAIASEELRNELNDIDAKWRPIIELRKELNAVSGRIERMLKLGATDTKNQHDAIVKAIEDGFAAKVRQELRAELEAIDASWKPVIELRKRLDEEFSTINDRIELILKSRATDTENQHDIITEAEKKLIRATQALEDAASKLEKLGGMSTTSTPSTDLISTVVSDVTTGTGQQQAADAGSAIASEELRNELNDIDAKWRPIIELRKELSDIAARWRPAIIHEAHKKKLEREEHAAKVRKELRAELEAIDARWKPVIELRSALRVIEGRMELRKELKAIDAQGQHAATFLRISRAIIGSIELSKELKAIDAKWKYVAIYERQKAQRRREERAAKAREELRKELNDIDAKWKSASAIKLRKDLRSTSEGVDNTEFALELRATDKSGNMELVLKLKATDTENQHDAIVKAIEDGFVGYAAECGAATRELNACGGMSTTSAPSTDLISTVVSAVTTGTGQQQSAGSESQRPTECGGGGPSSPLSSP